jgi:hypothetical protein
MADIHNKSFFGSNVGMILDSNSKTEQTLFLTFIRKKQDGSWEKPSNREGKKINLNLEELVWILEVLKNHELDWTTVHKFEDSTTKISVSWLKDAKEMDKLCFQVNGYKKYLNFAESKILTRLLDHIIEEKIVYSTIPFQGFPSNGKESVTEDKQKELGMPVVVEEIIHAKGKGNKERIDKDTRIISGVIQGETEKALKVLFEGGRELWIPKSTIHSSYMGDSDKLQKFEIDTWILKKNELVK